MKRLLAIVIVMLSAQVCNAQWGVLAPNRASTFEEGYLTGLARLRVGTGMYLNNLGDYLMKYEQARAMHGENWINGVKNRWAVKDEWKGRQPLSPDWIESRNKTLDLLERQAKLREREDDMIARGLLPARNPGIIINGVRYKTYAEYKATDAYKEMKMQQYRDELARQVAREEKAAQERESIKFLAMWDKMGWLGQQRFSQMSATEKAEYKKEFYDRNYQDEQLKKRADERFRDVRPYLGDK